MHINSFPKHLCKLGAVISHLQIGKLRVCDGKTPTLNEVITCNPSPLHILHPAQAEYQRGFRCGQEGELFTPCGTYTAPQPALLKGWTWFRAFFPISAVLSIDRDSL